MPGFGAISDNVAYTTSFGTETNNHFHIIIESDTQSRQRIAISVSLYSKVNMRNSLAQSVLISVSLYRPSHSEQLSTWCPTDGAAEHFMNKSGQRNCASNMTGKYSLCMRACVCESAL